MIRASLKITRCTCRYATARRLSFIPQDDSSSAIIFGSNTGVGKTIVSTGLSIAALRSGRKVCYIKPIQTGEMDQFFVQFYTNPEGVSDIHFRTLNHWQSGLDGPDDQSIGPDNEIVESVIQELQIFESSSQTSAGSASSSQKVLFSVVETVGGVLSPGPNRTLQADVYKPLNRINVVLVGDSGLGGIGGTLCAMEALQRRGYTVKALVFIDKPNSQVLRNAYHVHDALLRGFLDSEYSRPVDVTDRVAIDRSEKSEVESRANLPVIVTLSTLPQNSSHLLNSWFKTNESGFMSLFQAL